MDKKDYTDISGIIENNLFDFYFSIAEIGHFPHDRNALPAFISNDPGRWPAFVLGGTERSDKKDLLKKIAGGMQSGTYPPLWIIREPEDPAIFINHVREYNIMPVNRWTGMSLDKDNFVDDADLVKDLEIHKLGKGDQAVWTALVNTEVLRRNGLTDELVALMEQHPAFTFYCGFKEEKMVSTLLTFRDQWTTGLYFLSTDARFRRQGMGKAMMVHAVKDSFAGGMDQIVLHGTRDGENIYQKLGFRAYCHFDILWYFS